MTLATGGFATPHHCHPVCCSFAWLVCYQANAVVSVLFGSLAAVGMVPPSPPTTTVPPPPNPTPPYPPTPQGVRHPSRPDGQAGGHSPAGIHTQGEGEGGGCLLERGGGGYLSGGGPTSRIDTLQRTLTMHLGTLYDPTTSWFTVFCSAHWVWVWLVLDCAEGLW